MRTFKTMEINIHPAGYPFIAAFAVVSIILSAISGVLGTIGWVPTLWCVSFFRDPTRITPAAMGVTGVRVIAPGDGIVSAIVSGPAPLELGLPSATYTRISTFLSVFDVHVNRMSVAGTVTGKTYVPGKFLNAALDKASEDNERLALRVDATNGRQFGVVQIAGLVARRIVCFVETGTTLAAGERFGLIRFGSRVDVYLPEDVTPLVMVGQRMVGGETIMAELPASAAAAAVTASTL